MKRKLSLVDAVIFSENNEILCAAYSQQIIFPNYWEFSDGKTDKGEKLRLTLIGEIKEERGCIITVEGMV
ncbi:MULTISPECIES: NUDIX domain-containing protein [Bacillus]|uniref:NUDIX domain-containing protein n=1 Tax=Bacillus TaxID=1386 RepID=UPI00211D6938|nr:NUDIX domain-containing protein [Bacillus wiedmannii]